MIPLHGRWENGAAGTRPFGRGCERARPELGMTMVEVLVSLVILLFVSLALMSTALVSIEQNTKNQLRDEAVRIAEAEMESIRQGAYADMTAGVSITTVEVPVRNRKYPFTVTSTVTTLPQATQIAVEVSWKWKGVDVPSHTISTIRREP
jgi:type IV pilus assembly protein PilV